MGEVYHAIDPRLGRDVALKVLAESSQDDALGAERFAREARAASALNHPNVITIYEIGEFQKRRFIAMEFVRGRTFRSLVGESHPNELISNLGGQVARGLAVAHAAGIVHRDIKPENIMLRDDGYVKLLDFGVARLLSGHKAQLALTGSAATQTGVIVGTMRYMSPEQGSGDSVDTSTDLFSLGLVLYELCTGRHPFDAKSELGVITAIITSPATAPSRLNPAISTKLNDLVMSMLEKDPSDRPSAADVDAVLSEFATSSQLVGRVRVRSAPNRQTVGRDRERMELREAFESALSGRALVFGVAGEPGMGKTTLVEDFLSELETRIGRCGITRGRCSERLAGTEAYLPLLEALEGLLRSPVGDAVSRLMKQHAPTWYLQVAETSIDDSSERLALAHLQAGSQERMKRELAAFFEGLSRLHPVLLFLDDLQWADVSTVDMLAYLATRFASMRIMIVVTYRPSEMLLAKHPFSQLKLDLQSRGFCRELALEFLSTGDVERYLAQEFPQHEFPPTFSALIHARTEGSPLFMTDLLRYLRTRGVLANDGGSWIVTQSVPLLANELPESIRGMIQRKIDQLEEPDRRLLSAAAVQGYEFESAVIATVTGSDAAEVEERLETLEHVYGFVRRASEHRLPNGALSVRYRFVHVLYMNRLYTLLTPTRRAKLSLSVAEALLGVYGADNTEVAPNLALLFEVAGDMKRAVDCLLFAAQHSFRVFANQEAIVLARRGLELLVKLPDTTERARQEMLLQVGLALPLAATQGLARRDVGAAYGRAYELWKESGAYGELFGVPAGLWGFYIVAAQMDTALAIAEELLRFAQRDEDRAMLVIAEWAMGITLHHAGDHLRALDHFESGIAHYALELSPAFSNMSFDPGVGTLAESARVLWVLGYPDRALRRAEEGIALAELVTHPEARGFAPAFGAFIEQFRGNAPASFRHSEAVIAISRDRDIATTLAWGMVLHGWALAHLGRIDEGIQEILESLAAQKAAGSMIARTEFLAILADALIEGGRFEDALTAVEEGLEVAETTGDHYWDSELLRYKGELLLRTVNDAPGAERFLRRALDDARGRGARSLELRATMSLARLWKDQGRKDAARRALVDIYGWFTEGFDTADLTEARMLMDGLA
jgi:predicted ATPase